jgi:hypothetical protein
MKGESSFFFDQLLLITTGRMNDKRVNRKQITTTGIRKK